MFLCDQLDLKFLLFLLVAVSASLPPPLDVQMIAVDLDYRLHWDCNYTQLESPVTFTAEYVFSDREEDEGSYERACEGTTECHCDLTRYRLSFSGSFLVRVRAEAGLQRSNWTALLFTPDTDGNLAPPRAVKVTAGKDVLTLTISESVMSDVMKDLQYRVQSWERSNPEQKRTDVYNNPHAPMNSLKPGTEYCLRVSVFSVGFAKSSNYTSSQCVRTTDRSLGWVAIPVVLSGIVLLCIVTLLLYIRHKFRSKSAEYTTPEIILGFSPAPSLLEAQEECFLVAHVITLAINPTHTRGEEEQEQEHVLELQAPESICNSTADSVQDSGFSSGLES